MTSSNGHGVKKAVLYARVSTDEQARSGYSLAQQLEALREYAAREEYEVLEEVRDEGWSGAYLERPGLDRVRDLVEVGGVGMVLAQDADRITRDPGHRAFLDDEFERSNARLLALDDWGDDTHEGELLKFLKGWVSQGERLKMAERSRRGKLQKSREGKVIATMKPSYGFRYNEVRDGLVVHGPEAPVVEKIFRLAAEGLGTRTIQTRLYREGIPSPTGRELWHRPVLKRMILSDTYKPHTYEETIELVPKAVAAALDPKKEYGIRWWNRSSQKMRQVSETAEDGRRRYSRKVAFTTRDRQEWIAVPVPAFLPRELVEKARTMMAAPRPQERKNLTRGWELRGVTRCSCGAAMTTHTARRGEKLYHYYRCHRSVDYRRYSCRQRMIRAERVEPLVWELVSDMLTSPERVQAGMEALIEEERATSPRGRGEEVGAWTEKLEECDRLRRAYQDQQAAGLMTMEELRERLGQLEDTRELAQVELAAIADREKRTQKLERDRDALLEQMVEAVPEALDDLAPAERNELYRMLQLQVTPVLEGYEARGALCIHKPLSLSECRGRS